MDSGSKNSYRRTQRNKNSKSKVFLKEKRCFPFFILGITLMQVIFYILRATNVMSGDFFVYKQQRKLDVWRYFTLALVHVEQFFILFSCNLHLAPNLLHQLLYGVYLERIHGWKRVGIVFFSGTAFGGLLGSIMQPASGLGSAGAGTGNAALMTAYLMFSLMNPQSMSYICFAFTILALTSAYPILIFTYWLCKSVFRLTNFHIFIVCDICHQFRLLDLGSLSARVGGALAGVLVGISALKIIGPVKPWKGTLKMVSGTLTFIIFLLLVFIDFLNS